MKNAKFKFYSANVAINNLSVAVYETKNGTYKLQIEKNGIKVRGTQTAEMTVEQYENLPHDAYNNKVRFQAAAAACGVELADPPVIPFQAAAADWMC